MTPELEVALAAAAAAGRLLLGHFDRGIAAEYKGDRDLVTAADRESEALVRAHVAAAFDGDAVVGEEGPATAEAQVRGRRRWYVDPLDGTTNFTQGWQRWGVSIAYCAPDDRMAAGVVHLPLTGETFAAVRGAGATLDGVPIHVADVEAAEALAIVNSHADPALLDVARAGLSVRITGSTVADLADVACGRAGLYLGAGQGRWDLAAGVLIAAEAGAMVTDLDGCPLDGPGEAVFAAAPRIHAALRSAVHPGE